MRINAQYGKNARKIGKNAPETSGREVPLREVGLKLSAALLN